MFEFCVSAKSWMDKGPRSMCFWVVEACVRSHAHAGDGTFKPINDRVLRSEKCACGSLQSR